MQYLKYNAYNANWVSDTLVPKATLRGVAELHVASGMPQWRMFVTIPWATFILVNL